MLKSILAATVISLAATSAFAASPAGSLSAGAAIAADRAQSSVLDAQYWQPKRERVHPRHRYHGRYTPGHRYSRAPSGWHRYAARPYNWQTRGCILVGPIWFCP